MKTLVAMHAVTFSYAGIGCSDVKPGDDATPDPLGVAFGWTDSANARGGGLPLIAAPMMNTHRRWSMKQANVLLAVGSNIVSCGAGGSIFADLPTSYWSHAETRVSIDVEFATQADVLAGANVRVVGYSFVPAAGGTRDIVTNVVNLGAASVVVTLVWHFEAFVPNFDGQF
jgi:hypothetical protein